MKKTIKPIYAVVFCLLLLTNACKKNDLSAGATEQQVTVSGRAADDDNLPGDPNAELQISESLFDALNSGNLIETKRSADGLYTAVSVITLPSEAAPPSGNPCTLPNMIAAFNAYMATYKSLFQSWANQLCQPYIGCWCSPCGMCITFIVHPTRLCPRLQYQSPLKIFA